VRRKVTAVILSSLLALSIVGTAFADSTGYEGQPGNQSANNGNPGNEGNNGNPGNEGNNGNNGYEGQPGNQSNGG
jgi:hypothetical protein